MKNICLSVLILFFVCGVCLGQNDSSAVKYKLLATTNTSRMKKELDKIAAQGYRILVGSPTGGMEMSLFLSSEGTEKEPYKYILLAANQTGILQKELNEAAAKGFRLIPSTIMGKQPRLGRVEIVMILEHPPAIKKKYEYKLLSIKQTSALQKEIIEAGKAGFAIIGMISRFCETIMFSINCGGENIIVMERKVDAKL